MPTVYRFPKNSMKRNAVRSRDLELWAKHCNEKGIDPQKTAPNIKHPKPTKEPK
jgi:hypothetical protein